MITLSGYSAHSEPLFKQLNMLKIADQLRLQELQFYFKYIHKNLPAYLLDWEFISNVNIHLHDTRTSSKIHTVRTKHEFAKKCLTYNLPHSINATPAIVVEKIQTHSPRGLLHMQNNSSYKNIQIHVQYKIVIRVIIIIISYFVVNGWKPSGTLACLHIFRHICIAGSALILHLPRTFSYNDK